MAGILDPGDAHNPLKFLNDVNDPSPGQVVSTANVSGSIVQAYYGQVGKRLVLTAAMAATLSDTAIGTLYEGIYQYVASRASAPTNAPVRGHAVYWDDYENYIVSFDPGTANGGSIQLPVNDNTGLFAGVLLSAPTAGNYFYIQIAGKATLVFKSPALSKAPTANSGDLVVLNSTTNPLFDVPADATNITSPVLKRIIGVAIGTPTGGSTTLVDMWSLRQVMGGLRGF